jgi:integrase
MPKIKFTDPFIKGIKSLDKRQEFYDLHVKGLTLRVYPTGKKTFSYEYKYKGKKRRLTFGEYGMISLKMARDKVNEAKMMHQQGFDPQSEIDDRRNNVPNTISSVAERYKKEHVSQLAPKTQTEYIRYLDDHIIPKFGRFELNDLPRNEIVKFLNEIAIDKGHHVTANRLKATLSGLYTFHIREGYDVHDPTKNIKKYTERPKDRVYNDKEIKELWEYFGSMNEPIGSLYKMLLLLARRKSETWSAEWEHIQDGNWKFPAENVKTNETFVIPLTDFTEKLLEHLKKLNPDSKYVFQSSKKKDYHIVSDSSAKKKVQLNTSVKDFTPHDLRRTAITKIAQIRTPRDVAERISIHSQKRNSYDIYDRYDRMDEKKEFLTMYHEHLLNIFNSA